MNTARANIVLVTEDKNGFTAVTSRHSDVYTWKPKKGFEILPSAYLDFYYALTPTKPWHELPGFLKHMMMLFLK